MLTLSFTSSSHSAASFLVPAVPLENLGVFSCDECWLSVGTLRWFLVLAFVSSPSTFNKVGCALLEQTSPMSLFATSL